MSPNAQLLLALLDLSPGLERALGDAWPAFRDDLLVLAGRLENDGDTPALRRDVDAFVQRLLTSAPAEAAKAVRGAVQQAAVAGRPTTVRRRGGVKGAPQPAAGASTEPDDAVVVPIFYGTDRAPANDTPQPGYSGTRGTPGFGVARVSVPTDHKLGKLEGPRWWRLEFRPDPSKHIVLLDVQPLARDAFLGALRDSLASGDERDALVFVHGYNVGFADAARRAAQIAVDLKFPGRTLLYSWSSAGNVHKYTVDEATIEWSTPHVEEFLTLALTEIGARTVHVIAHSMGNRALTSVLERFDPAVLPAGSATLGQIVFAAPDVDGDTFRRIAAAFRKRDARSRSTLYASSTDVALKASKLVHGYPRAGDAGDALVVVDGVDTVDATNVDTSLISLRHSYFGAKRSILSDMFNLIRHGHPPDDRMDLQVAMSASGQYWLYRR